MNKAAIYAIERILSRGDRAEVIPGPGDSVKVIRIRRDVAYQVAPTRGRELKSFPDSELNNSQP